MGNDLGGDGQAVLGVADDYLFPQICRAKMEGVPDGRIAAALFECLVEILESMHGEEGAVQMLETTIGFYRRGDWKTIN